MHKMGMDEFKSITNQEQKMYTKIKENVWKHISKKVKHTSQPTGT